MTDHHSTSTIREAVPADYAALAAIATEGHTLHATAHPSIFRADGNSVPQDFYDTLLAQESSTIQVAEAGGTLVGFAIVEVFDAPPVEIMVPRRTVFIGSMAVTATQRGRGIGRALVTAAIEWGRARGATTLDLKVWEFNQAALAFYERLGLVTLNRVMQLEL